MDFKIGRWEDYKKLQSQFLSDSKEVNAASSIHKIGLGESSEGSSVKNVAYYLKYSKIEYTPTRKFNVLLNEIEGLEKYGPFYSTETTTEVNALPDELSVVKRALNALDQTMSQFQLKTGEIKGILGRDTNAPFGSLGARAAVFIGMAAALYGKHDVSMLLRYSKDMMRQFTKKIEKDLRKLNLSSSELPVLEKARLAKKIINIKLIIMIGMTIVLVITLHYLLYRTCHQNELYYVHIDTDPHVSHGKKIMDSVIAMK